MRTLTIALLGLLLFPTTSLAEAPAGSSIKVLSNGFDPGFKEVSPLDLRSIRSAAALRSKDGKQVQVFLSNGDFTADQMANEYVLPLKSKKEFILVLTFHNGTNPAVDGTYSPKAGYGKPFWSSVVVRILSGPKGTNASLGANEGTCTIKGISGGRVTGSFQVKTRNGDKVMAEAAGTFDAPLTTSKY
ncbi:MAG: hypothetical protein IPN83_26025 [Holophagales bacterium]|nr:hypothetical protein [Holophagales bacterium]